jgi:hypothetical protein
MSLNFAVGQQAIVVPTISRLVDRQSIFVIIESSAESCAGAAKCLYFDNSCLQSDAVMFTILGCE